MSSATSTAEAPRDPLGTRLLSLAEFLDCELGDLLSARALEESALTLAPELADASSMDAAPPPATVNGAAPAEEHGEGRPGAGVRAQLAPPPQQRMPENSGGRPACPAGVLAHEVAPPQLPIVETPGGEGTQCPPPEARALGCEGLMVREAAPRERREPVRLVEKAGVEILGAASRVRTEQSARGRQKKRAARRSRQSGWPGVERPTQRRHGDNYGPGPDASSADTRPLSTQEQPSSRVSSESEGVSALPRCPSPPTRGGLEAPNSPRTAGARSCGGEDVGDGEDTGWSRLATDGGAESALTWPAPSRSSVDGAAATAPDDSAWVLV